MSSSLPPDMLSDLILTAILNRHRSRLSRRSFDRSLNCRISSRGLIRGSSPELIRLPLGEGLDLDPLGGGQTLSTGLQGGIVLLADAVLRHIIRLTPRNVDVGALTLAFECRTTLSNRLAVGENRELQRHHGNRATTDTSGRSLGLLRLGDLGLGLGLHFLGLFGLGLSLGGGSLNRDGTGDNLRSRSRSLNGEDGIDGGAGDDRSGGGVIRRIRCRTGDRVFIQTVHFDEPFMFIWMRQCFQI